jgi:hypothetical protein
VPYHVEISPQADRDIRAIGALLRRAIARAIRGVLGDPDADYQHFAITGPLRGVVVGNVVAVFRFMMPEELTGLDVPGRYVIRVLRQDELEAFAAEQGSEIRTSPPPVRTAAEDLARAILEALRGRQT